MPQYNAKQEHTKIAKKSNLNEPVGARLRIKKKVKKSLLFSLTNESKHITLQT